MSTSIAVLPAYRTSKTTRTKARADRTIFGTTLDNSAKAQKVFQNDEVHSSAQELFEERHKKWRTPTPSKQILFNAAWGIKDFSQTEIGEEHVRGYSRLSTHSSSRNQKILSPTVKEENIQQESKPVEKKSETPFVAYKDRFGVYNVYKENVKEQVPQNRVRAAVAYNNKLSTTRPLGKPRSTGTRKRQERMTDRSPTTGGTKQFKRSHSGGVQVPKFPLPRGTRNHMRTSSLKITETGAKDLINARPINKIGLGETLQYNHESFKKREIPNQYLDHGNVFSLGQKGHTRTTNGEVTGPGGFYTITTPNSSSKGDDNSIYSMPYEPSIAPIRRTQDIAALPKQAAATPKAEHHRVVTPTNVDEIVPLNILHKFGADEVRSLLQGKEREIKNVLEGASDSRMSHSERASQNSITQLTRRLHTTRISGKA